LSSLLVQLVSSVPFLAIWAVAMVLALSRWNKHPTASVLVLTGGVLEVMAWLGRMVVPGAFSGGGTEWIMWVYTALGLVSTVGLACLVAAAFVDRATKSDPPVR
jgi:hypothetical protein